MSDARVLVTREGALAILSFNDPASLNALDDRMQKEFAEIAPRLCADESVRAILITGEGRSFCAGANLKGLHDEQKQGAIPKVAERLRDFANATVAALRQAPKPVIAAVNGPAVGFGCGVALSADIVLMGKSAYFLQSFVNLGVVPDGGGSYFIPRLAGEGRAAAMMLLGERIDAPTALAWGLAYRVYEDEALMPSARALAARMASGPTNAYARIKQMVHASCDNDLAGQLELEAVHQRAAFASADCREGIAAFVEKRPPQFSGR